VVAATVGAVPAAAAPAPAVHASSAHRSAPANPYSPSYRHAYRHGAVPTRAQQARIRAYAASHQRVRSFATTAAATGTQTLSYRGGVAGIGVTSGAPKVYLVFWGSQWGTAGTDAGGNVTLSGDTAGGAPYLQKMFRGLGTDNEAWSGTMTQYCDGSLVAVGATTCPAGAPHIGYPTGGALAGVWYDNSAVAPTAATGSQLGGEAVTAAAHFGNLTQAANRYTQYVVLSPPGANPDNYRTGGFCAWHSYTGSSHGYVAFTNMPYVMDAGGSCGAGFLNGAGGALDGYSMVLGHEYAETITDQLPDSGWVNVTGSSYNGEENADECAWLGSGQQGGAGNIATAYGSFAMQGSWSNDTNRCDLTHATVGATSSNTVTLTNPGAQATTVGVAVSKQLTATDSAAGSTITFTAAGLPAGLTISSSGLVAGTPTTVGTRTVSVTATDNTGAFASASFTWAINSTIRTVRVTSPGALTSIVGAPVSKQLTATDSAVGATLTFTATGLPAGLSISASGLITGTPTTIATTTVTARATDETGAYGTAAFTWVTKNLVTVTNPGPRRGTAGVAVSQQMAATDSAAGATLTFTATGLPTGLAIRSNGLISGTPTTAGTFNVTVTATDQTGAYGTAVFSWPVAAATASCATAPLKNGGFESNGTSWTLTPGVASTGRAHSGTYYAWLDGYGTAHTDSAAQTVVIPAGCHVTLSYYLWVTSSESPATAVDTLSVKVGSTTLQTFSNADQGYGYVPRVVDLSAYAGSTVTLSFVGVENAGNPTSFLIDDAALTLS
jgi:serine protease